jgi:hypothetical protein
MATITEIYETNRRMLLSVPTYVDGEVCWECRGPTYHPARSFSTCFGCKTLFDQGVPYELRSRIVPISLADSTAPCPWYLRLQNYKKFSQEHIPLMTSVAHLFMIRHRQRIADLLGGPASLITIVPSRKLDIATHPLRIALTNINPPDERVRPVLSFRVGATLDRRTYDPDVFDCIADVEGERVILVEDLWVSGGTPLSAAGALMEAGAASVMVMPLGRKVDTGSNYYPTDYEYFRRARVPHDITTWPR